MKTSHYKISHYISINIYPEPRDWKLYFYIRIKKSNDYSYNNYIREEIFTIGFLFISISIYRLII